MNLNLKINGIKSNNLSMVINGQCIGTLDIDHSIAKIDYTEQEFEQEFYATADDLRYAISDYYDELIINEVGEVIDFAIDYRIDFAEEEED